MSTTPTPPTASAAPSTVSAGRPIRRSHGFNRSVKRSVEAFKRMKGLRSITKDQLRGIQFLTVPMDGSSRRS